MWSLAGKNFTSRLLLGSSRYRSPQTLKSAIERSGAEIVTVSLRRQTTGDGSKFWEMLKETGVTLLPNTANCRSAQEAITTAHMAREVFGTNWIKLETVGDEYTLQPDPYALLEATQVLVAEGFEVFPYTTEDLVVAERLIAAGCKILMPWGSPIGSGQGIANARSLKTLRTKWPKINLIVDAGIGAPSHAAQAMELGFDGIMLNTAVALADDSPKMAEAFSRAIEAGRLGYEAGLMLPRLSAEPSTPTLGTPFWSGEKHS